MANKGIAPLDPTTAVGRLRAQVRDVEYLPLNPVEPGFGDYGAFSDVDLAVYLAEANGSQLRAAGLAIQGLALEYSAAGKSIRTEDLTIDVKSRGRDLLSVAQSFFAEAAAVSAAADSSFFEVVRPGRKYTPSPSSNPFDNLVPASVPGYWTTP